MTAPTAPRFIAPTARWPIPELDANGEIDDHAEMCLRFTVQDLVASGAAEIVIDLRDLTSINADAVALLAQTDGACRAAGAHLGLLIGGCSDSKVAHVLQRSGLPVHTAAQAPARQPARSQREHLNAHVWRLRAGRE